MEVLDATKRKGENERRASSTGGGSRASHQGNMDWGAVAHEGLSWMVSKATERTYCTNPFCQGSALEAQEAGLVCGAYRFLTNGVSEQQLDSFLSTTGEEAVGKLVMVDVEALEYSGVDNGPSFDDVEAFVTGLRGRIGDRWAGRAGGRSDRWWCWHTKGRDRLEVNASTATGYNRGETTGPPTQPGQSPASTPLLWLAIGVTAVVIIAIIVFLFYAIYKTPGRALDYGNFFIVALGIIGAISGFLVILIFSGGFRDTTQALGFLTALFGVITGLVGTFFGVKQSSDAAARAAGGEPCL